MATDLLTYTPITSSILLACCIVLASYPVIYFWDRFSTWWLSDLLPLMDALNIDRRKLTDLLRWWGASLIVVPLVIAFVLRLEVLALPLAFLLVLAPRLWLQNLITTRRQMIRSQLSGAMVGLANTSRAGLPISNGLKTVATELKEPLRGEFNWIILNHQAGRALPKVLEESKVRLNIEAFTLFVATIQTTLERGGRVTEMLDRLSESIREMDRLERMMDSSTASSRKVILILSIFPVVFLGAFSILFPEGTKLMFSTILGQVLLLMCGLLIGATIIWSNKILQFR